MLKTHQKASFVYLTIFNLSESGEDYNPKPYETWLTENNYPTLNRTIFDEDGMPNIEWEAFGAPKDHFINPYQQFYEDYEEDMEPRLLKVYDDALNQLLDKSLAYKLTYKLLTNILNQL